MAYNTGNPIGSKDPRDLSDNAENLDTAVNTTSDHTWTDRLGNTRKTWLAVEESAPIATAAADRADSAADRAEQEADRAEAAADIAFVNAAVYESIADGLAATTDGDQFSVVEDDEIIRYLNDDNTAVEVARYPTASAVAAIPARTDAKSPEDAERLIDPTGRIIRRTDAGGEQYIPGLGGRSVQGAIRETESRVFNGSGARRRTVWQHEDGAGTIVARQSENGALYLPGMPASLHHAVGSAVRHTPYFRSPRDGLRPEIRDMVLSLIAEGRPFIPPPDMLVPNLFDVPDGIISAFSVQKTTDLWLDTPYGDGGLVHPYVLELRRPMYGYKYVMLDSPHRNGNANEENAILYGSNDLATFDLIPDVPQPLGYDPRRYGGAYNSDPTFTYDPRTGALIAYWRAAEMPGGGAAYFYRATWNGIDWTPEAYYYPGLTGSLSPSILYDPYADVWRLWCVTTAGLMLHATAPAHYGPWTLAGTFAPAGFALWHLEVKWMGNRFMALAQDDGENGNLYLGISSNGTDWTFGPALIDPPDPYPYKGTFLPEFDGDKMRLRIMWNTYVFPIPAGMTPTFHSETTDWVDLNSIS